MCFTSDLFGIFIDLDMHNNLVSGQNCYLNCFFFFNIFLFKCHFSLLYQNLLIISFCTALFLFFLQRLLSRDQLSDGRNALQARGTKTADCYRQDLAWARNLRPPKTMYEVSEDYLTLLYLYFLHLLPHMLLFFFLKLSVLGAPIHYC